jgi:low molecular weight protein-tyrosine phosphatase
MTDPKKNSTPKESLRRLVPPALLKERGIFLRLGPVAGPIYARLRLLDWLGIHSGNAILVRPGSRNFLFVCFGNLMRSPMAEVMFREASASIAGIQVTSAGLHAVPGTPAHPWAVAASAEFGLSLAGHQARQLTAEMVSAADAIFAMDYQNKAELLAQYPDSKSKILMLSAYASGAQRCREIPDPYFGSLFTTKQCYSVIQECVNVLTTTLATAKQHRMPESSVAH